MKAGVPLQLKIRVRTMVIIFLCLSVASIGKLVVMQFFQYEWLTLKAEENWDREIPFSQTRGNIRDRDGELIVGSKLAPTLYFMPAQSEDVESAAAKLSVALNVDKDKLVEQMSEKTFLIKLAPEGKNIELGTALDIQSLQIPGLYTGVDYVRDYPHDELLSRLLGFTGYDHQGLAGIEFQYNEYLTSTQSTLRLFTDAKGNSLPHVNDGWGKGEDGATVELTIDLDVHEIMERTLSQAMEKYDADQAMGIAMNPKTGEILSLASFPTFHPLEYDKVSPSVYNQNLPVSMTFEPGSTFKIITLAAALEEGKVDLENDSFYDPGYAIVEGARLRCWKREGHKHQSFLEVVENSCNPGFIELGQRVGREKLSKYIRDFGFGQKTGSSIAGESTGILFSKESYGPVEHATTSFGQGISVTPIQQVQAVSAAVNGGTLFQPYVVKRIYNEQTNEVIKENEPTKVRQVISEETSKQVRESLESVVANGSGRNAFRDTMRIGGKTGTAQKAVNGRYVEGQYIVSFIGFAPANDPEIVVYVAIDNPKHVVQFGGVIAAPIVGEIIEDSAPFIGFNYNKDQIQKEYRWGDNIERRVPDLVGQEKNKIMMIDEPFKIEWHGTGTKIISQLPQAESLLSVDGTIHLYLGE
ncbi:penicillin-binding transpeptidase domain-containing protein [Paenisporosarcina macmurdoensis]|jgi:stage V sporulation protein D (sporulation-specific penicillin-binding protein)|uniref:Penicillin-binding transpeptidase domain-containing protein n=1 Tax=Paenisporosarcina macmurdoensis TaxID=212659 RepID=A0ABW1L4X1_9BACL